MCCALLQDVCALRAAAALRRRRDEMGIKHSPWCKFVDECEPVDDGHGDGVDDGGCHDLGHQRGGAREQERIAEQSTHVRAKYVREGAFLGAVLAFANASRFVGFGPFG